MPHNKSLLSSHCYIKSIVCAFHTGERRCPAGIQRSNLAALTANLTGKGIICNCLYSWDLEVLLATCHRHRHESLPVTFGCERLLLSVHCNQVSPLQLVPQKQVFGSITCWPSKGTKYLCSTFASVFITICGQLILFWFPSHHVESLQLLIPVSCLLCKLLASVMILHICFLFIKPWTHLSFLLPVWCKKKESAVCHCYGDSHKTWWVLP